MSSPQSRIQVHLPPEKDRSYPVVIQPGCFQKLPEMVQRIVGSGVVFLVTDTKVGKLYGRPLLELFAQRGIPSVMIDFPAG